MQGHPSPLRGKADIRDWSPSSDLSLVQTSWRCERELQSQRWQNSTCERERYLTSTTSSTAVLRERDIPDQPQVLKRIASSVTLRRRNCFTHARWSGSCSTCCLLSLHQNLLTLLLMLLCVLSTTSLSLLSMSMAGGRRDSVRCSWVLWIIVVADRSHVIDLFQKRISCVGIRVHFSACMDDPTRA